MTKIEVILNGRKEIFTEQLSILNLLKTLNLNPEINIVEKNEVFVDKNAYQQTCIDSGDKIEIIRFVGGG